MFCNVWYILSVLNYLVSCFNFLKIPRHKNQSLLIIPGHTISQFSSSFTIMLLHTTICSYQSMLQLYLIN
ncbi:hypothetical protein C0J52_19666 [Blattella germanica]|nr:hypothetical protein C0J52_19666 [Blattella germanica]